MRINWERLPRLALPLSMALLVGKVLMNELGFSRLWAVPCGLWVAVQVQHFMQRREMAVAAANEQQQQQQQTDKSK